MKEVIKKHSETQEKPVTITILVHLFPVSLPLSMCVSFVHVWICSFPAYADIFINIYTFFYKIDIIFLYFI